jgi:hypothetical protein
MCPPIYSSSTPLRPLLDFNGIEVSFYFNPGRFFKDSATSRIQREG